jgi:hypothetical protein
MRRNRLIWLLLALSIAPKPFPAQTESTGSLTVTEYVQTLDQSLTALWKIKEEPQRAADFLKRLPPSWNVQSDGAHFEISTEFIRHDLEAWQGKPTDASFELMQQHLETLRRQATQFETAAPDLASCRSLMNNILSRKEFRNVRGESWMDRLKQRIRDLLFRLLGKFISASAIPIISNVLVYALILIAVLALAYWMYRSLRDGTRMETILPANLAVSAKEWPVWLSEARNAADRGEWRDAIHLAYWGGISFLEAQGAWRPDRARTPREYLRLLPASSDHQPTLRALTLRLEGVWYGMQAAGSDGFEQTLAELERLGCRCG